MKKLEKGRTLFANCPRCGRRMGGPPSKAILAGLALALFAVASSALPRAVFAGSFWHHSHLASRTVTPGLPAHVDPRFGIISFEPSFARREPVHPAFQPQPFPPQMIIIQPAPIWTPGQWVWSGRGWVWVPDRSAR